MRKWIENTFGELRMSLRIWAASWTRTLTIVEEDFALRREERILRLTFVLEGEQIHLRTQGGGTYPLFDMDHLGSFDQATLESAIATLTESPGKWELSQGQSDLSPEARM